MHDGKKHRRLALGMMSVGVAAALAVAAAAPATAAGSGDSLAIDFSGYDRGAGEPAGKNGWITGSGVTVADYDWAVVDNSDFPDAGLAADGTSLRLSNWVAHTDRLRTIRQLSSPRIAEAGTAASSAEYDTFEASFTVASATGGLQPGLNGSVAIDKNGGRGGGYLGFRHIAEGLQVWMTWVPEGAPSVTEEEWRNAAVTVSADEPHDIRWVTHFGDEDHSTVYIDGALAMSGKTWATYHRIDSGREEAVDSLLFRTGNSAPGSDGIGYVSVTPAPEVLDAVRGNGLLFSEISYASYDAPPVLPDLPTAPPVLAPQPNPNPDAVIPVPQTEVKPGASILVEIPGFAPYEDVYITWYSDPVFGGWFRADASGVLRASIPIPSNLPGGTHTLQATGATTGFTAAAAVQVAGTTAPAGTDPSGERLPDTGFPTATIGGLALLVLLAGGAVMLVAARRRTAQN